MILAIFELQVTPTKFWVNWPFSLGEEEQNSFSRWWPWQPICISSLNHFNHFRSTMPQYFQARFVSRPCHWGEEGQTRFSRWCPWLCHHLGYPIRMILAILYLQFTQYCLPNLEPIWGSGEKSAKYIFKMAAMAAILDFLSKRFSFDLQVKLILSTRFRVSWSFGSAEEAKNRFSGWHHFGFPIWMILAIFDLQVAPILPTKFGVNWPFGSGEVQNDCHLWFLIGENWSIFDLQVAPILPTKFCVNWPFGSGGEVQKRFSSWRTRQPFWISDLNDFSYFWSASCPDTSYQLLSQLAFRFRRRRAKRFSRWLPWRPSGISDQNDFSHYDLQVTQMLPIKSWVNFFELWFYIIFFKDFPM